MDFILGFSLLVLFQLLGEITVIWFELPVSGPVVGILLLLTTLIIRGKVDKSLQQSSSTLLGHLSLMFVPAGVGLMVHYQLLAKEWLAISGTLILGTLIMLATTALIMNYSARYLSKGEQSER